MYFIRTRRREREGELADDPERQVRQLYWLAHVEIQGRNLLRWATQEYTVLGEL